MIRIAVCDDEKRFLSIICEELKKEFSSQNISIELQAYSSGSALREDIFRGISYDILFLDIFMPDLNGIFLANHLRKHSPNIMIIFISSHEETVFESFTAAPFRFLRKRTFLTELPRTVRDINAEFSKRETIRLLISDSQKQLSLNPYKIIYVEACNKLIRIHTTSLIHEVRQSFSWMEKQLDGHGFLKIHRSILVNYCYIHSIQKGAVYLDNGEILPISKYRLTQVKEQYQILLQDTISDNLFL